MAESFITKDSGERMKFDSGMQRDTEAGKIRFDLALDGPLPMQILDTVEARHDALIAFGVWKAFAHDLSNPSQPYVNSFDSLLFQARSLIVTIAKYEGGVKTLFARYAELMTRGAAKYEARNWMKATGQAELDRFAASAERHFYQWWTGNRDEDHAAAVIFNLNGFQYVIEKMGMV